MHLYNVATQKTCLSNSPALQSPTCGECVTTACPIRGGGSPSTPSSTTPPPHLAAVTVMRRAAAAGCRRRSIATDRRLFAGRVGSSDKGKNSCYFKFRLISALNEKKIVGAMNNCLFCGEKAEQISVLNSE